MQVAGDFEPLADDRWIEFDLRKDRRIGMEVHRGPRSARGAELLQLPDRLALREAHLVLVAVAPDGGDQLA